MRTCCHRGPTSRFSFYCARCRQALCLCHTAMWTDGKGRCPNCFEVVTRIADSSKVEVTDGESSGRSRYGTACIVVDGTYVAGAQKHVLYLLDALKGEFRCHVVSILGGGRWFDQFRRKSAQIVVTDAQSAEGKVIVRDFIDQLNPVVINAHLLDSIHCVYELKFRGYVATVHSFMTPHERPVPRTTASALKSARIVLTPAVEIEQRVRRFLRGLTPRIIVLPNAVATDTHRRYMFRQSSSVQFQGRRPRILYVGRLDEDKIDLDMLISTLRELRSLSTSWVMDIVGDGEMKRAMLSELQVARLSDFVTFHGFQDDVGRYYRRASVVFFPSLNEGLSIAALEAMAAGRVVIATDVGDMASLAVSGGAIVVRRGDSKSAADIIWRIVGDHELRTQMSVEARRTARQFSFSSWREQMISVFREACR